MHLIIGGAYQGKLEYAQKRFGLLSEDICDCSREKPDFSKKCLCHLERAVLERPETLTGLFEALPEVVICEDVSCGVVPVDAKTRAWREDTGRLLTALAQRAESVTRLFCGLPQRLK